MVVISCPFFLSMECLIDYIGLRGCGSSEPESGLFINELYGVQFESIQKIANSEQKTFQGVWDDVQIRSIHKLSTAVTNYFRSKYQIKKIADTFNLGKILETTTTSQANELRGFYIETENNSNFTNIYVQSLTLYLAAPANTTIKIYDTQTGTELYTKSVTGVAGWNDIKVNKTFRAENVFIGYNSTTITSTNMKIDEIVRGTFECFCNDWFGCQAKVRGGTLVSPFKDVEEEDNTFGLSGVFGVRCSYDNLVCDNKDIFKVALWYLLGHELMNERIYTPRLNKFTTIDLDKAKSLRDEFKNEYEKELSNAIEGIHLNTNDCCLICDAQITYKESRM